MFNKRDGSVEVSEFRIFLNSFFKSYSGIFFISNPLLGFILFVVTMLNPNMGFSGFLCVAVSYLFAKALGLKDEFLNLDYYIYNPLLIGLGIGFLFKLNVLTFILIMTSGILVFLLTFTLSSIFSYYFKLPVLSIPFVIGSFILYLASLSYSNLFVTSLYPNYVPKVFSLPSIFEGFFNSLGAVFFSPYTVAGLIIFIAILFFSRILAFLAVVGYLTGIFVVSLMTGSFDLAVKDISAFNFILIAMAVGGVFLIPSPKSYFFAFLSTLIAVPIIEATKSFWNQFGVPVFALPFNTVTLLVLYTVALTKSDLVTGVYKGTPEDTLDHFITSIKRFKFWGREIYLPFTGEWTVWQSFDDKWTHKGAWKHAVDFVITDDKGETYDGDGVRMEDYYAYKKPVLSPVSGTVVKTVSNIPDNPIGKADRKNNFGNHVIVYDSRGFYIVVAHLLQDSVKVKEGEWIERGTLIGLCGNSGYSPQPHIHVHVQLLPEIGSPTVPFSFCSFACKDSVFIDAGVPETGKKIVPMFADKKLKEKLNFLIDMFMKFEVFLNGVKVDTFTTVVKMAPDGTFYLSDGKGKLFFGIKNDTFYFYNFEGNGTSYLKLLMVAASKIPLVYEKTLRWFDFLPLGLIEKGFKKALLRFFSSFNHTLYEVKCLCKFSDKNSIFTDISFFNKKLEASVVFHESYGFKEIRVKEKGKEIFLRRVEDEKIFVSNSDVNIVDGK